MTKIMITVRMSPEQYNEVLIAAQTQGLSINEYCLRKLGVSDVKQEVKGRGRRPSLRSVREEED